jgi:serine/threonine protein kinase
MKKSELSLKLPPFSPASALVVSRQQFSPRDFLSGRSLVQVPSTEFHFASLADLCAYLAERHALHLPDLFLVFLLDLLSLSGSAARFSTAVTSAFIIGLLSRIVSAEELPLLRQLYSTAVSLLCTARPTPLPHRTTTLSLAPPDVLPVTPRITRDFVPVRSLGCGAFASVILARSKVDSSEVAIKLITIRGSSPASVARKLTRAAQESRTLAQLPPHPNVVTYRYSWTEDPSPVATSPRSGKSFSRITGLTDDFLPDLWSPVASSASEFSFPPSSPPVSSPESVSRGARGSDTLLHSNLDPLSDSASSSGESTSSSNERFESVLAIVLDYLPASLPNVDLSSTCLARHLLSALAHVHGHGIVHRDLKPSNVLVRFRADGAPIACLADFGLSVSSSFAAHSPPAGTATYLAPELLQRHGSASPASDVFALGLVLLERIAAPSTFSERQHLIEAVLDSRPCPSLDAAGRVGALTRSMLARDPAARPSAAKALAALEGLGPVALPALPRPALCAALTAPECDATDLIAAYHAAAEQAAQAAARAAHLRDRLTALGYSV